jgi:DNA-binding MarR family transcriptional regulator
MIEILRLKATEAMSDAQPESDERQRLVWLLRRLSAEMTQLGHTFAGLHGLHQTDTRALVLLMDAAREGRPMSPGQLGRELNLSSAAVTALVDRLEGNGHVRRGRDRADRRRVILETEPVVEAMGRAFFGPLNTRLLAEMETFDDRDLAVVARFLTAMTAAISAERAERDGR